MRICHLRTTFQLILPVHSHNVTNNLTDPQGPQIYQINRQTNSFQNMCNMLQAKIDRLCKKTPQNRLFWWTRIWVTWPWTPNSLTPGQLQAYPWKIGGMTVQTSYVTFFPSWHGNSQKSEFLVKCFVPENFQQENFSGPTHTESLCTLDSQNIAGLGDRASVSKL